MKLFSTTVKYYLLIFNLTVVFHTDINAQDASAINYLQEVGDYAFIFNGRIEPVYSSYTYENLPYYINSDFTEASVVYKNIYYPNQKARLDLFKEQLIILPTEKRFGIVLNSQNVNKVFIHGRTFIFLNTAKDNGMKKGFYIQLLEENKIQLICKENFNIRQKLITYVFDRKVTFFLRYNGRYYTVKNKGSFSKIFPQYKKQINQYVKDNKLNFRQNTEASLTSLAVYCEKLLTSI